MNIYKYFAFTVLLFGILLTDFSNSLAEESVIRVKTLTFDSIVTRRGIWKFPDANQEFRKIIMNYTLKCDPRTPHDKYNCGEWDYSSYIKVHRDTGKDTVYKLKHPKYKLGSKQESEFTILNDEEFKNIKDQKLTYFTISKIENSIKSESNTSIKSLNGSPDKVIKIAKGTPFKAQYYFDNQRAKEIGINGANLGKIRLKFSNKNAIIKNLKVRVQNQLFKDTFLINNNDIYLYNNDFHITNDEWSEIPLSSVHRILNKGLGFVIIISADQFVSAETGLPIEQEITAYNDNQFFSTEKIFYPEFDGKNDFIQTEQTGFLQKINQFTMEGFVKINKWSNWSKIMGVGDKIHFEIGDTKGDLYFMLRNGMNSNVKISQALKEGEWAHIAAVYSGSEENNQDKLKIYINGQLATGVYNGVIPYETANLDKSFSISSLEWGNSCINGSVYNVRLWNKARSNEEIKNNMYKFINTDDESLIFNFTQSEENIIDKSIDRSGKNNNALNFGFPLIKSLNADDLLIGDFNNKLVPAIEFVIGEFEMNSKTIEEKIYTTPKIYSLSEYKVENGKLVLASNTPTFESGYQYSTDINRNIVDSVKITGSKIMKNDILTYNSSPERVYQNVEIGRFITPYGIGLDLGPDGFTWKYDVTDYFPILNGEVELSAGNLQELVDVTFDFYKGTAPRKVMKFTELWGGYASLLYKDLDNNTVLNKINIPKEENTVSAKVRTRITGHGHFSNTGAYPHCCEWTANTHYLAMNDQVAEWKIWQEFDCALNPVYPQGGTWPGSREGWCPGDVVKDIDFELDDYSNQTSENSFDYEITPVPSNNIGMGNGFYEMAFHFFEYSHQSHSIDAEIYEVFAPSNKGLYSRKNPLCSSPVVVIRNNGNSPLNSLIFTYNISGGSQEIYKWEGNLKSNILDTIYLPIKNADFWKGDGKNIFNVKISDPNNEADQYAVNDTMSSEFTMPDIIDKNSTLEFLTPNYSYDQITLTIKDMFGNVIYSKNDFASQKSYKIPLEYQDGCYTLELTNNAMVGIKYWAVSGMIPGSLKIKNSNGTTIKNFNPDFGYSIVYSFNLGNVNYVQNQDNEYLIYLFPNPANNEINCKIDAELAIINIDIMDISGKILYTFNNHNSNNIFKFDISNLSAGNYFIKFSNDKYNIIKNFIKK